jgi:hypothetical protein
MDPRDTLLAQCAALVAPCADVARPTPRVSAQRARRGSIFAGIVALSLGGGTAAMAGTGTLDDLIDYYLSGDIPRHNDHAWEMDITGVDGTLHCYGGIVVMPLTSDPDYVEAHYLAIKQFVQEHDWSELNPDPGLLRAGQKGTAEQLAITADRHMIEVAQDAGFAVDSITTRGFAQCDPK